MPSTFFGLSISKSGLNAAQAGINTTAHNASNATTKGYSRQIASQQANVPISVYSRAGMAGTGTYITGVERQRNQYYDEKYRVSNAGVGKYETREYYLSEVQNYFKEVDDETKGLTASMTSFYTKLEDLKKNPGDSTTRTAAIEYANNMTEYVNYLANKLQTVQQEANTDIKTTAERINSIASQVASLNKQINKLEIQGGTANDLRDQRDLLLDELSQYANISVSEINRGDDLTVVNDFTVKIDGKTLVDTYRYVTLNVTSEDGKVNQNDVDGLYKLTWSDGQEFDNRSPSLGGKLQALFDIRDGNNETYFTGIAAASTINGGELKVTGTNCNDLNLLNIPAEDGQIQVGTKMYKYDSFTVDIATDGTYTYTFQGLTDDSGNKGPTADVTDKTVTIGSSIDYKGIPYYQAQMNEFCRVYAQNFNMIHNAGQDLNGDAGMDFFSAKEAVSGKDYDFLENRTTDITSYDGTVTTRSSTITSFSSTGGAEGKIVCLDADGNELSTEAVTAGKVSYYSMTGLNFTVNKDIQDNVIKMATSLDANAGVENTDVVDMLIGTNTNRKMFNQGTPAQFLHTFTANIGTDTQQASIFHNSQKNITAAIDSQRMSVSSVDEDEEAMNLVKYKNAYELSGKMISTMSQLYDVLMNM